MFENFKNWAYANGYKPEQNLSLDRIDNNKNYCPENCRWIPRGEQMRNTCRNKYLTAFGETKLQKDWTDDPRCITSTTTFKQRIAQGWATEKALTTPSLKRGKGA